MKSALSVASRWIVGVVVLALSVEVNAVERVDQTNRVEFGWGDMPSYFVLSALVNGFQTVNQDDAARIVLQRASVGNEGEAEASFALVGAALSAKEQSDRGVLVGKIVVVFVANPAIGVKELSYADLVVLLGVKGKTCSWARFGCIGGSVNVYGDGERAMSHDVVRQTCMQVRKANAGGWYVFRDDIKELAGAEDVLAKVRQDRNAIGFFSWNGSDLRGVRVLSIKPPTSGLACPPLDAGVMSAEYPISQCIWLQSNADSGAVASRFIAYAAGKQGAEVVATLGVLTPYAELEAAGRGRLAETARGKGTRVLVIGSQVQRGCTNELVVEYVRAKAAVQLSYAAVAADVSSIGAFIAGGGRQGTAVPG
jgi:hypothetical protein